MLVWVVKNGWVGGLTQMAIGLVNFTVQKRGFSIRYTVRVKGLSFDGFGAILVRV
jgi:hypothetical protein